MKNKSHLTDDTIIDYLHKMGIRPDDVDDVSIDNEYKLVVKFAIKTEKKPDAPHAAHDTHAPHTAPHAAHTTHKPPRAYKSIKLDEEHAYDPNDHDPIDLDEILAGEAETEDD